MSIFDRFLSGKPEHNRFSLGETENPNDNISLEIRGVIAQNLNRKMKYVYPENLSINRRALNETRENPAYEEALLKYLFELYKFQIRLSLIRSGTVNRQTASNQIQNEKLTQGLVSFQENIFNKAFDIVRDNIALQKLQGLV